jgi:hypothetical protein
METVQPTSPQSLVTPPSEPFRGLVTDAIRYWELRRLVYNLVLAAFVAAWVLWSWPHFRPAMTWHSLLLLSILAFLANLCYCAAYLVDLPLRASLGDAWKRWRWTLWLVGMLFAILFENYWIADEIYPFVQ